LGSVAIKTDQRRYFRLKWCEAVICPKKKACYTDRLRVCEMLLDHSLLTQTEFVKQSNLFDADYYSAISGEPVSSTLVDHYLNCGALQQLSPSPLFDAKFYRGQFLGERLFSGVEFLHYVRCQSQNNPHPLFDTSFYLSQLNVVPPSPIAHFLSEGTKLQLSPSPLFDLNYYLEQNRDVAESGINPLIHYVLLGAYEGRNPSILFDANYYFAQIGLQAIPRQSLLSQGHPLSKSEFYRVANSLKTDYQKKFPCNPLIHYLKHGAQEARDPHPLFSTEFYIRKYGSLLAPKCSPLEHYLTVGYKDKQHPHPLFDVEYYEEMYSDIRKENPLQHFLKHGAAENRNPNPLFNTRWYKTMYPDVSQTGTNPLIHYILNGAKEVRDPSSAFSSAFYLQSYKDIADAKINPLQHYLERGSKEKRRAKPEKSGLQALIIDRYAPYPGHATSERLNLKLMEALTQLGFSCHFIAEIEQSKDSREPNSIRAGYRMLEHRSSGSVEEILRSRAGEFDLIVFLSAQVCSEYLSIIARSDANMMLFLASAFRCEELKGSFKHFDKYPDRLLVAVPNKSLLKYFDGHEPSPATLISPGFDVSNQPLSFEERSDICVRFFSDHEPSQSALEYLLIEIMPLVRSALGSTRVSILSDELFELPANCDCANTEIIVDPLQQRYSYCRSKVTVLLAGDFQGCLTTALESLAAGTPCISLPSRDCTVFELVDERIQMGQSSEICAQKIIDLYSNQENWTATSASNIEWCRDNYRSNETLRSLRTALWKLGSPLPGGLLP
jgi:hypothetical protein